jgi:hypothetical protein
VTALAGLLIAAGTVLALVPQFGSQSPEEVALSALASPSIADAAGPANESIPAMLAWSVPVPVPERAAATAAARPQAGCDDLSGSFLAPQCQFGKTGRPHMTHLAHAARMARTASSRVAPVPIGREPTAEAEPQGAAAPRPSPTTETAAAAPIEAPAEPPPIAPAKKPVKTEHKQTPGRDANAVAAAPSPGFGFFGLFHEPSRTGIGAWAMSR